MKMQKAVLSKLVSIKSLILCFSLLFAAVSAEPASVDVELLERGSVVPHEMSREPGPKYVFWFKGFPKDQPVTLSTYRPFFSNGLEKMGDLDPNQKHFYLGSAGFLPGEAVMFCFTNADQSFKYEFPLIPQPMRTQSKDGSLTLEARLSDALPTRYHLFIGGLKEGEKYKLRSVSGHEVVESELVYSRNTRLEHSPGVLGKEGGQCILTITDSRGHLVKMYLPWGAQLLRFKEKPMAYSP